ncbi:acyl-CoA dehydrogenase domain protein [Streptomyces albus]|uniref:Acyl-CoA dehydrogenase domain protein n=1 Tax=Streptomyces albus (strain ATCC 21838 / DSM 41398 / FERM P-419 / JCM 4703 / NBRC 107858) TaxID=1081613 RepID=A0A0B5EZJ5_STRA4|nr:acyl-CoA dehydrogenase domain protein [Streptomyces albus]AOU79076.1 acyl-CoA dehydrogenase domain protein [Streptomyces albus]AYN34809.1 acyl-CoA dehydrogenase [Streptomyces albus]
MTGPTAPPEAAPGTGPAAAAEDGLPSFAPAARLEQELGCPFDPDTGMSLARGVRADDREAEPTEAYEAAWAAGLHARLVPAEEGGSLTSFESLLALVRAASRRDAAVSVGLGSTLLATLPVWIWGEEAQRRRVAELALGRAWGTAGISEEAAGSDLLATGTRAVPVDGGYLLNGEKWLVGNGRRSSFATVLAASEPSFGLFLLDFEDPAVTGVRRLAKVPTHGLRGHDLSGFALSGCRVGEEAVIGRRGRGIEMVSGMLQFTRTLVGGSALGSADTALRIALRHARGRILYGAPATRLAPVRGLLARGFADLLVAECTALAAARGLDVARQRMPLWSAVAKYVVPQFAVDSVAACGEVLSARAYLREGAGAGAFQKIVRDLAITPVFEGTQLVQLDTVRAQLASAARRRSPARAELPLPLLFGFGEEPASPSLRAQRPALTHGGADEVTGCLDEAVDALHEEPRLAALAHTLRTVRDQVRAEFAALGTERGAPAYEAARRHCLVHAGACCLHTWLQRRRALGPLAADPAWLSVALRRVLERLGRPAGADLEAEDRLVRHLTELDDDDRALSLIPLRLAPQHREAGPVRTKERP